MEMAEKLKRIEGKRIPGDFNYSAVNGLSREVLSKLQEIRPANLGQAGRIPGITPAAVALLMVAIERLKRERGDKRITENWT
jgi:tRNA uridine 5-carboxymethylaminomethyl modification enzyme